MASGMDRTAKVTALMWWIIGIVFVATGGSAPRRDLGRGYPAVSTTPLSTLFPFTCSCAYATSQPTLAGSFRCLSGEGRRCVREHRIEKEVCHVRIPEAVCAPVAQPGRHRTRGLSRLCRRRGGPAERGTQGVEARVCGLLLRGGGHFWRLRQKRRRVAGGEVE